MAHVVALLEALQASSATMLSALKKGRKDAGNHPQSWTTGAAIAEAAEPLPAAQPGAAATCDAVRSAAAAGTFVKPEWLKGAGRAARALFSLSNMTMGKLPRSLLASAPTVGTKAAITSKPTPEPHMASASSKAIGAPSSSRSKAPTARWSNSTTTDIKRCAAAGNAVTAPLTATAVATKASALRTAFKGRMAAALTRKACRGSTPADSCSDITSEYASASSIVQSFASVQSWPSLVNLADIGRPYACCLDAVPSFSQPSEDDAAVLVTVVKKTDHPQPVAAKPADVPDAPGDNAKKLQLASKIASPLLRGAAPTPKAPKAPSVAKAAKRCTAGPAAPKSELAAAIYRRQGRSGVGAHLIAPLLS
ncbi:hypothetical protein MNEG_2842 [Monoraphidium neglectum]|uniref:Uncharacterized protein n=1 Tax=Monoraphidium neglectum TaxID=145388 RepID=A0A0D2NJW0_9CHLO|nr:hypothetical protein MNEG_2842 [Monoraphidium neglectum]KIZ05116.1 hypothetical protein MNEG_2842 [Monoraphidium neglectum]|eukprot:XP_013904135.1 hypothetical protein MNEG_2842 [Monoraphidium neglectum]